MHTFTHAETAPVPAPAPREEEVRTTVDGVLLSAALTRPAGPEWGPLIVALHGGTYTRDYWRVPGSPAGSLTDTAVRNGHPVLAFDRPGYGGSDALPEAEHTFDRHADLLERAIGEVVARFGFDGVALLGHSIGGMIALDIASRAPGWPLVCVAVTGVGAVNRPAAAQLGSLPLSGVIDLPADDRDAVMFGPPGSHTEQARTAARGSYAPTPFTELVQAPSWADDHLPRIAARVRVPVHQELAEQDALWVGDADTADAFARLFTAAPAVHTATIPECGHSVDHHRAAAALHLRQLAFVRDHAPLG
ncbi:alpha/beta hydrolase [Nocardiopsis protaetiae]|uniref:alpha/beta hydrolase n=1 Tax=Nocardiopsis protaetiae TaxID=3382270 RepID=UPI00387B701E